MITLFRVNSIANTSAYQLQQTDIRVNSICPGLVETGMTEETFEYARRRGSANKIGQLNALGRYAVAEGTQFTFLTSLMVIQYFATEIANVAAFLASGKNFRSTLNVFNMTFGDDASYINGQNIAVDGGLTASLPVIPGRWA